MRPAKRAADGRCVASKDAGYDNSGDASDDSSDQEWDESAEESTASEAGSHQAGRKRRTSRSTSDPTGPRTGQASHPAIPTVTQGEHRDEGQRSVRKYFGNVRAWINVSTTSAQTRIPPIGLPENMLTVYSQPPIDVGVAFVVDGQAVEQEGAVMPKVRVYLHKNPRTASGKQMQLTLSKACGAHQHNGYLITGYTAESGSTTSEPRLTLHLKSPAAQEAEKAELRAEEERTGWVVHNCHQSLRKQQGRKHHTLLVLTQQLLDRAFPGVQHKGMKLQITIVKDGVRLPECEGERNLKYYCSGNYVTPRLNINTMAAAALVGCRVERLKAKQPNLLQVIATTVTINEPPAALLNATPDTAAAAATTCSRSATGNA